MKREAWFGGQTEHGKEHGFFRDKNSNNPVEWIDYLDEGGNGVLMSDHLNNHRQVSGAEETAQHLKHLLF